MEVRGLTVGPVQENSFIASNEGRAFIVDPGDEAERLLAELEGLTLEAILLTHTHFDHVGAVAPIARATGAPVYCPELEKQVLANIMDYVPWPGFGPFESYEADHLLGGGERLQLIGHDIDVIFTPGHSPGHVSFSLPAEQLLFSGDVLFQSSIGRTDLPGGDHGRLLQSIQELLEALPEETRVLPGHMGVTTLGAERATNPFLSELV
jgi:glyoxylase-like metal-dependent hydrolase (beta-lactamase superfamily II)